MLQLQLPTLNTFSLLSSLYSTEDRQKEKISKSKDLGLQSRGYQKTEKAKEEKDIRRERRRTRQNKTNQQKATNRPPVHPVHPVETFNTGRYSTLPLMNKYRTK